MTVAPFAGFMPTIANAAAPAWDASGTYTVNVNYLGTDYTHDMNLTQDNAGNLTGNGGSPAGSNTYTWTITSGSVSSNTIDFYANYTATADAVTPQTVMHVTGTIANDGTMSGTWSDNYQGSDRTGTWMTTSGTASEINYPATVKVTIVKYIDGTMATAQSAQNNDFPMSATWNADNIGAGTGTYTLGPSTNPAYQAMTVDMTSGADYSTNEVVGGAIVGASCDTANTYRLDGYSVGNTMEEAQQAATTMTAPAFTDLMWDKFVIVKNITCGSNGNGGIGGEVVQTNGVLSVDSITVTKGSGTADGTFANGWIYTFRITDPNNEPKLAMKFSDWVSGANTIPVANNMRISSLQADNGNATITLTAANTYSTPPLNMVTDLDPNMSGRQVEIKVEVAIPNGTPSGSYTTTYGIQSTP